MAEWSNVPDSKSGVGASPPWARIPPSPPKRKSPIGALSFCGESEHARGWDSKRRACKRGAGRIPPQRSAPKNQSPFRGFCFLWRERACSRVGFEGFGLQAELRPAECRRIPHQIKYWIKIECDSKRRASKWYAGRIPPQRSAPKINISKQKTNFYSVFIFKELHFKKYVFLIYKRFKIYS